MVAAHQSAGSCKRGFALFLGRFRINVSQSQRITKAQRVVQFDPFTEVSVENKVLVSLVCHHRSIRKIGIQGVYCFCQFLEYRRIDALLTIIFSLTAALCSLRIGNVAENIRSLSRATGGEYSHSLQDIAIFGPCFSNFFRLLKLFQNAHIIRVPETVGHPIAFIRVAV